MAEMSGPLREGQQVCQSSVLVNVQKDYSRGSDKAAVIGDGCWRINPVILWIFHSRYSKTFTFGCWYNNNC
jgi:hypothetical protein